MEAFDLRPIEYENGDWVSPLISYGAIVFLIYILLMSVCISPLCVGFLLPVLLVLRYGWVGEDDNYRWRHMWI